MRDTIAAAIAAFLLGSITTGVLIARAQPAGPPPGAVPGSPPEMGGPRGGWAGHGRWDAAGRMERLRTFALVYRAEDRQLTPPDVRKIAEAFLLWNGNHTWKVLNVAADGDKIRFDLATADGATIARFAMDPKTGQLTRLG